MNDERMFQIILGPYTTEKSVTAADKYRQITLKVAKNAGKIEIKKACEKLFKVVVESVNVSNVSGKVKRFKQGIGKQRSWKKAIITLKEGHDINWAEFS